MKLLTIENNEIRLNSALSETAFGKTKYEDVVTQEGVLFDGKSFLQWTFDEVKSYPVEGSENLVFYCAKNPLSADAKTLAEYLESDDEKALAAVKAVSRALTIAAINGNEIPVNGSGGILIDLKDIKVPETSKILFVPEILYQYSANSLNPKENLELRSGYINETIHGLPAICFERAAIIYRLLTGKLPFAAENIEARNADILDKKFLPLELCINGIDTELAEAVNNALKLNSNAVNQPGKKQKGKKSEDLTPVQEFPLEKLEEAYKLSKNQPKSEDFDEKAAAYLKNQTSKINAKRNIRRNSTTILAALGGLVVLAIIIANTISSRGSDYTSVGLTSSQTIQGYFYGVNEKDVSLLSDFSTGKSAENFDNLVTNIYVLHKQRLAYNASDNGFANPANWLFFITDEAKYNLSGIFGITNLKIDDKAVSLSTDLKKRNEKPSPLTKEGNVTLQNGSVSVHKIEFYMLISGDEDADFEITKATGTATLTFKKNRWVITEFNYEEKPVSVDSSAFKKDYFKALSDYEYDVMQATESLKKKYPWMPEKDAMQREKEQRDYYLSNPYAVMGF